MEKKYKVALKAFILFVLATMGIFFYAFARTNK